MIMMRVMEVDVRRGTRRDMYMYVSYQRRVDVCGRRRSVRAGAGRRRQLQPTESDTCTLVAWIRLGGELAAVDIGTQYAGRSQRL